MLKWLNLQNIKLIKTLQPKINSNKLTGQPH